MRRTPQHIQRSRGAKLTVTLVLAGSLILGALPAGATAPDTPRLRLTWVVMTRQCTLKTTRVAVKRIAAKQPQRQSHVRQCATRAVRTHGSALHLRWRQHGEVRGRLTLAQQPIAGATIILKSTTTRWSSATNTITTNVQGRFSAPIHGPADWITITYQPPGDTTAITDTKRVHASAHLSLHVSHLAAHHTARFWGILYGGYVPQDLYIQFWYLDGSAGWQPFANLTIVDRHNGHWHAKIPIPRDARGYTYHIRATVVPSPDWPWATTNSRTITRLVS